MQFNEPVIKIEQADEEVILTTASGNTYKSQYLVIAVPPCVTTKMEFEPRLPVVRQEFSQRFVGSSSVPDITMFFSCCTRFAMGKYVKCLVFYDSPWWREKGFSGLNSNGCECFYMV
jgi:monoamine oxidase